MWAKTFLIANGGLYILLGLWCTLAPSRTSAAIGFGLPNASARSEYLVVYGGLELAMGLFFLLCALRPGMLEAGLWFAALTYALLMIYRWVTIIALENLSAFIYTMVGVETIMAALSIVLLWQQVLARR